MSHYNSDNWCGEEGYMIYSKHRRRLMFLFEKAISAKVVSRGNLSILCRWHEKFSRTWERNKNRPLWKCWQSLMEEWANIQDSFESLPKLCKLWIFWGRIVQCTAHPQESQCCSFHGISLQICVLLCERMSFHFRKLFQWWFHFALSHVLTILM